MIPHRNRQRAIPRRHPQHERSASGNSSHREPDGELLALASIQKSVRMAQELPKRAADPDRIAADGSQHDGRRNYRHGPIEDPGRFDGHWLLPNDGLNEPWRGLRPELFVLLHKTDQLA